MSRFRDDPIGAFRQELKNCTRESKFYDPPEEFVLASRLLEWLRESPEDSESSKSPRATIILDTVYKTREPWAGAFDHFGKTMAKSHNQCWLKLLVILLQMDHDGSFARYLHAFCRAEIWDSALSDVHRRSKQLFKIFQQTELYVDEQCRRLATWFIDLARQLSAQKAITMYHDRQLERHMVLPITAKDHVDSGGQSKVFRIEVPQECVSSDLANHLQNLQRRPILDDHYPDGKSFYYEFALKKIDHKADWIREVQLHRALRAAPTEGMVQCLGSWEVQTATSTEYYLLMELGSSDLDQYFRTVLPPSIAHHIYLFWRALSNVLLGLSHIHDLTITSEHSDTKRYYVWHGDIKPANILICVDGIKLTDPGWAQLVPQADAQKNDKGLPVVVLGGGTGSYGGPERIDRRTGKLDRDQPVTQGFDIWSLGCVFLEAATWVILGERGVDQFRIARKMAHKRGSTNGNAGDDCFHDLGYDSDVIGDWIEYLHRGVRNEDLVSGPILKIIKKEMLLVLPHERIPSDTLARLISRTLRDCEEAIKELPRYSFPNHLEPAIELEEKEAAEASENLRARASSGKPMLSRSVRFAPPRGPLIDDLQPHELPAADPRAPGPSHHPHPRTGQAYYPEAESTNHVHSRAQALHLETAFTQFTQRHHPAQSAQLAPAAPLASHPPNRSPARTPTRDSTSTLPPPQEPKQPKFDYYDALDLLIRERRWTYSSHLEHPDSELKPPAPRNLGPSRDVGPATKTNPAIKKASTFSAAASALRRSDSTVKKGDKSISFSSALSQAWHTFKPQSKLQRGKGSNPENQLASQSGTRPGAAPVQSTRGDPNFDDLFKDRDIIILVDNSSSMIRHWPQIQNILPLLMAMMYGQDDDGIDLFFTSSLKPYERLMEPWQVIEPLREKDPRQQQRRRSAAVFSDPDETNPDDIYKVLSHILGKIGPDENDKYRKRTTILILTDGVWPTANTEVVAEHISNWLRRMSTMAGGAADAVLKDRYYSIQFVQLGDEPAGTEVLEYLDDEVPEKYKVPDVIDVEPASGHVMKMIMGSLVPEWDNKQKHKTQSSTEPMSPHTDSSSSLPRPPSSPPGPLPHQHLSQRTGSNYTTARGGGGTMFHEPISEELETNSYTPAQISRPPSFYGQQRTSPPVQPGQGYDDLGVPLRNQHPYGFATAQQQPQQPQRRATGQGGYRPMTPDETPTRPRRRETGGLGSPQGYQGYQ